MKCKTVIMGLLLAAIVVTQPACSKLGGGNARSTVPGEYQKAKPTQASVAIKVITKGVMGDFQKIVSKQPLSISDLYSFIKENSKKATKKEVTSMMVCLEELMVQNQAVMQGEFAAPAVQKAFQTAAKAKIDYNQSDKLQDAKAKELVKKAIDSGYKIGSAEGIYAPMIDYTKYSDISKSATDDMVAYVELMSTESQKPYANDGSLQIGWDEVIKRGNNAEDFLNKYESSPKAEAVNTLYKKYEKVLMFGLDNTPMFDSKSKAMNADAKKAIEASVSSNSSSKLAKILKDFLGVVGQNGNKLTPKVDQFRNKSVYSK
jgi:hypothetical protein